MRDFVGIPYASLPEVRDPDFTYRLKNMFAQLDEFGRDSSRGFALIQQGFSPIAGGTTPLVDLTNFFYLPGRFGGQVAYGDTNASGTLTLGSTNNSTKGKIFLGSSQTQSAFDESTGFFGVGLVAPAVLSHVQGTTVGSILQRWGSLDIGTILDLGSEVNGTANDAVMTGDQRALAFRMGDALSGFRFTTATYTPMKTQPGLGAVQLPDRKCAFFEVGRAVTIGDSSPDLTTDVQNMNLTFTGFNGNFVGSTFYTGFRRVWHGPYREGTAQGSGIKASVSVFGFCDPNDFTGSTADNATGGMHPTTPSNGPSCVVAIVANAAGFGPGNAQTGLTLWGEGAAGVGFATNRDTDAFLIEVRNAFTYGVAPNRLLSERIWGIAADGNMHWLTGNAGAEISAFYVRRVSQNSGGGTRHGFNIVDQQDDTQPSATGKSNYNLFSVFPSLEWATVDVAPSWTTRLDFGQKNKGLLAGFQGVAMTRFGICAATTTISNATTRTIPVGTSLLHVDLTLAAGTAKGLLVNALSTQTANMVEFVSGIASTTNTTWNQRSVYASGRIKSAVLFTDDNATIASAKLMGFDLTGITAGQTRTLTVPNYSGTIAVPVDEGTSTQILTSSGAGVQPTWAAQVVVDSARTWSTLQKFKDNAFLVGDDGDITKSLVFSLAGALTNTQLTLISSHQAARSITFPDATGTLPLLSLAQTWTAKQTFNEQADTVKILVKGNAAQTAYLQEWQDDTGQTVGAVKNGGTVIFGDPAGSRFEFTGNADAFLWSDGANDGTIDFSAVVGSQAYVLPAAGGDFVLTSGAQTMAFKTLNSTCKIVCNGASAGTTFQAFLATTKQMQFALAGITAGNTRVLAVPDTAGTIVLVGNTASASGVLGTIALTGQTGNLAAQTMLTGNASSAGLYRLSFYLKTTTAGTPAVAQVKVTVSWNDGTGQTVDVTFLNGVTALAVQHDLGTLNAFANGDVVVKSAASQNITFTTTGTYTGAPAYSIDARIESLG